MELILDKVSRQYGTKMACSNICLRLTPGVYGLLGANGAGKTTLMRMICGVLKPTSGTITFNQADVHSEAYRDRLSYLPQDFGYYPEFTAQNFLLYLASLKGLSRTTAKKKTLELLSVVSLEKEAKRKIKTFSGGMKQRLGIAQAMLNNPSILVLDEPTAGLDPKERVRFRNLISRLGRERIVLLSTHIVSDVEYIADTIFLMKDGKLLHQGSPQKILQVLEGKVWECLLPPAYAEKLCTEKSFPIVNIRQEEENVLLRLVSSQKPSEDAMAVTATLEDLYLYYFSEEASL